MGETSTINFISKSKSESNRGSLTPSIDHVKIHTAAHFKMCVSNTSPVSTVLDYVDMIIKVLINECIEIHENKVMCRHTDLKKDIQCNFAKPRNPYNKRVGRNGEHTSRNGNSSIVPCKSNDKEYIGLILTKVMSNCINASESKQQ